MALGLSFLWSGAAKLADRGWPGAARAFGVTPSLAALVAPVELLLGAALVTGFAARGAAVAGLMLLVAYTVLIARLLRSGDEAPPCACFGSWSARPVSGRTVARNVALAGLAALAMAG